MLVGTLFIARHGFAQDHHHGHENHEETQSLIAIMQGMEKNLYKLTSAILIENFPAITSAAHDIAYHPGIAKEDLHHLFERLGPLKEDFIECDNAVHDLARDISKAGEQENMDLVLEKYSAMLVKTVECHREYNPKTGDKE